MNQRHWHWHNRTLGAIEQMRPLHVAGLFSAQAACLHKWTCSALILSSRNPQSSPNSSVQRQLAVKPHTPSPPNKVATSSFHTSSALRPPAALPPCFSDRGPNTLLQTLRRSFASYSAVRCCPPTCFSSPPAECRVLRLPLCRTQPRGRVQDSDDTDYHTLCGLDCRFPIFLHSAAAHAGGVRS